MSHSQTPASTTSSHVRGGQRAGWWSCTSARQTSQPLLSFSLSLPSPPSLSSVLVSRVGPGSSRLRRPKIGRLRMTLLDAHSPPPSPLSQASLAACLAGYRKLEMLTAGGGRAGGRPAAVRWMWMLLLHDASLAVKSISTRLRLPGCVECWGEAISTGPGAHEVAAA
ncbi:hypothetical protein B0J12DRAFT_321608 [Macrophomina phaseolina]|uniref:Uncharacterized protein n=1 Tax=Macrophomina phaseolina TaxID=35725 RepID=A0ABQ8FVZ7_9PEZI|nr:hypothetical protein B0J12DRAFT_321608 [Macrophomina phaseolina]